MSIPRPQGSIAAVPPAAIASRRRPPFAKAAAATLVVAAAATAAFALAGTGSDAPAPGPAPAPSTAAGVRLQTSFGSVSVDYVARLTGSDRPMGLRVPAGHVAVQVGLTVTNIKQRPVRVDDALIATSPAAPGHMDTGSLRNGQVPPMAAHRVVVRAVVAGDTGLPRLLVRDPARDDPFRVALGGRPAELGTLDVSTHRFGGRGS